MDKISAYRYRAFLILFIIAVIGYWQVAFMQHILKWDNISGYLPYRYFIAECIRNHQFPFWNSYQFLGYPIYSDPEAGTWYPLFWAISILMPYNLYAINLEFFTHIVLAGMGAYSLCVTLKLKWETAVFAGATYMFAGFLVETGQILAFTIGIAWVPFLLNSYLLLLRTQKWKYVIHTVIFSYLLVTGGYPAFTIICFYILLVIIGVFGTLLIRQKKYKMLRLIALQTFVVAVLTFLLSSAHLNAIYQALPYFSRGGAIAYDSKFYGYAIDFISFLGFLSPIDNPIGEGPSPDYFVYVYFGLINLILFFCFPFVKKNRIQRYIFFAGVFFFLTAMGGILPIRYWLYQYVPGMNLFRHPIIFYSFAQLCFMINIAYSFEFLTENYDRLRSRILQVVRLIIYALLISFSLIAVTYFSKELSLKSLQLQYFFGSDLEDVYKLLLHAGSFVIIFTSVGIALHFSRSKKQFFMAIALMSAIDLCIAVQLNTGTKIVAEGSFSMYQHYYEKLPKGFPKPDLEIELADINDGQLNFTVPTFWKNLNTFSKQTATDGYSSFILNNFNQFRDAKELHTILNHPLVFFSSKTKPLSKLSQTTEGKMAGQLCVPDSIHEKANLFAEPASSDDTLWIKRFFPSDISVQTTTENNQILTLLQNDYPGWNVYIDDQKVEHFRTNHTAISTFLPKGNHTVRFVYTDEKSEILFYLSISAFFVLLIALFLMDRPYWPLRLKHAILLLPFLFLWGAFNKQPHKELQEIDFKKMSDEMLTLQQQYKSNIRTVINTDQPEFFEEQGVEFKHVRFKEASFEGLADFDSSIDAEKSPYYLYAYHTVYHPDEVVEMIKSVYPKVVDEKVYKEGKLILFSRKGVREKLNAIEWTNGFEKDNVLWGSKAHLGDTSHALSGFQSYRLDTISPYGPVFSVKYDHTMSSFKNIVLTGSVFLNDRSESLLTFAIQKENKPNVWKTIALNEYFESTQQWNKVWWCIDIYGLAEEGDIIKSYFWNLGKKELYIDDLKIQLKP